MTINWKLSLNAIWANEGFCVVPFFFRLHVLCSHHVTYFLRFSLIGTAAVYTFRNSSLNKWHWLSMNIQYFHRQSMLFFMSFLSVCDTVHSDSKSCMKLTHFSTGVSSDYWYYISMMVLCFKIHSPFLNRITDIGNTYSYLLDVWRQKITERQIHWS